MGAGPMGQMNNSMGINNQMPNNMFGGLNAGGAMNP